MKKKILPLMILLTSIVSTQLQAQSYSIGSGSVNACSGTLYDAGGSGGTYGAGACSSTLTRIGNGDANSTISICFDMIDIDGNAYMGNNDYIRVYSDNGSGTGVGTTIDYLWSSDNCSGCSGFCYNGTTTNGYIWVCHYDNGDGVYGNGFEASFSTIGGASCNPNCANGIWDAGEYGVDCGGTCSKCGNTSCSNAHMITDSLLPLNLSGLTTCGSGDDFDAGDACASNWMTGEDYVFEFTPSDTIDVKISATNSQSYTGLFVTEGCPDAGGATCVASDQPTTTSPEISSVQLLPNRTYYITISTHAGVRNCGVFDFSIQENLPPSVFGSSCMDAYTLFPNVSCANVNVFKSGPGCFLQDAAKKNELPVQSYSWGASCSDVANSVPGGCSCATANTQPDYSTYANAGSMPTSSCGTVAENGFWTKFDATATSHDFENSSAQAMTYTIFTGSCGALTEETCMTVTAGNTGSYSSFTVGTTYYMFVQSTTPANEIASVCLKGTNYVNPNDGCSSALTVTDGNEYLMNNANGTSDLSMCSGSTENNIWLEWTVPPTWSIGDDAYIHVYNQDCNGSAGLQLSVYSSTESCATIETDISATVVETNCELYANPASTQDYYFTWTPAAVGETFVISIDGYAGTACEFNVQINNSPVIILPIEEMYFKGHAEKGQNVIEWATATEQNSDYFEIEYSTDGKHFDVVGKVWAAGHSTSKIEYKFLHKDPNFGLTYYRYRQVDVDGSYYYSEIIAVNNEMNTNFHIESIVPSIVQQDFNINLLSDGGQVEIGIFDIVGKQVYYKNLFAEEGMNNVQINFSEHQAGVYFIQVLNNHGDKEIHKFVKR